MELIKDEVRLESYRMAAKVIARDLLEKIEESHREKGKDASEGDFLKLKKMFYQCFINTIDTTVKCINEDEVFVITGDIEAMWLRDSSAEVVHYLPFIKDNESLKDLVRGLIKKQFQYILLDPYANAFNIEPNGRCWDHDITESSPWNWERKFEIDSLCYPVWLLHEYYRITKDRSIFTDTIHKGLHLILEVFHKEQGHEEESSYSFIRLNCPPTDTLSNDGKGSKVAYTGMIWSGFRPSDDACQYGYLIPSNMFAAVVLTFITFFGTTFYQDKDLADKAQTLQSEIEEGIRSYGIYNHKTYGYIYAYETDGLGNYNLMDDANVPSLLSIPWLKYCNGNNSIYKNTRRFILSKDNPYYYEGLAAKGIGSLHTPKEYIWHIGLVMRGLTSLEESEKEEVLLTLIHSDGDTGYMHEGFHCDDPKIYTRDWFAWANSLFALYILKYYEIID